MDSNGRNEDPDTPAPFLELTPPPWVARGLPLLLVLIFSILAIGSAIVHVPEVVSSPFSLVPVDGSDPIRAPQPGIVADLLVREGSEVIEGQAIMTIVSPEAGDRSAELRSLEAQLDGGADALINAQRKRQSERQMERREQEALTGRIDDLGRMLELARNQLELQLEVVERRQRLHDEGLTSWEEVIGFQLEAQRVALETRRLESERATVHASLARLTDEIATREVEFAEIERRLKEETDRYAIRADTLRQQLVHSVGGAVSVPAPCSGSVLRLLVRSRGAVVQEGELLGDVTCGGSRLEAELAMTQAGIGRVQVAQPVKLLYDTFPYQRYGVRHGRVRWIGPASVRVGDGMVFRVLVDPADEALVVDGRPRTLMPGMTGEARIVVGTRSILSYALAPLRQLRENLAVPPDTP